MNSSGAMSFLAGFLSVKVVGKYVVVHAVILCHTRLGRWARCPYNKDNNGI